MKSTFKGFYNPNDEVLNEAWRNENTIFVFDTNVFLNLYGYAEQTRDDFFELLDAISDKIWIPYQVGLEYQRRRLEIIKDEKAIFNKINDNLKKIEKIFQKDFQDLALKRRFPTLQTNTEKLNKEINKSISNYRKSVSYWDEKQPCVRSHDTIREQLNSRTEDKVGNRPVNQEWLDDLYKEGAERYENKIPPGFEDTTKSKAPDRYFFYDGLKYDRQFGDLILWKQLLEKAKEENIENVIFVTDDSKEDWWYILDSRGKKQIGPHANLQNEIYSYSNINLFFMYNTSSFLENGKNILEIGVHESSITDAYTTFQVSLADTKTISGKNIHKILPRSKLRSRYRTLDDIKDLEELKRARKWEAFDETYNERKPAMSDTTRINIEKLVNWLDQHNGRDADDIENDDDQED